MELTNEEKKMFKNCEFVVEEAEKEGEASGEQVNEVSGEKEVNLEKEMIEGSKSNEEERENENEGKNENDGYKTPPDCEFENDFNFTAQMDSSLHEAEIRDLKIEKQKLIADLEELEEKHNDLNDKYEELCASHLELSQVLKKKEEDFETNMNDASIRIVSLEEDLKEMDLKKENEFELRLKEKELRMEEEFQRKLKESSTRIEALEKQIKENEDEKEKQLNVQNNDERLNMANEEIKKLKKLINENEVGRIDEIKALNNKYAKDVEKYVVQIGKLTKEIAESEKEKEVMRSMIKTVKTRKRTKLEDDDFDYTTNTRQIKKGAAAPTKKPKKRAAQTTKNEPETIDVENIEEKEPEPVKPLPPFNRKFSLTT